MRVENNYSNSYYAKENAKQMAVNAASSAVLSAGLTLAFNKGQNPKNAAKVGLIVAGISVVLDLMRTAFNKIKAKKTQTEIFDNQDKVAGKLFTHQG